MLLLLLSGSQILPDPIVLGPTQATTAYSGEASSTLAHSGSGTATVNQDGAGTATVS